MASGERPELGNEVRIGQEAHVEDQVSVFGHALAKAETHARNQGILVAFAALEALRQHSTQFVNIELRGVDHQIGQRLTGCNRRRSERSDARTEALRPSGCGRRVSL